MYNEIDKLIEDIVSDYRAFVKGDETRVKEFQRSIEVNKGSKYIRIVANNTVWGFINKSNDKFHPGDILKSKNWKTPTLNRARGNILSGKYHINWTGPLYLHDVAGKGYYSWQSDELASIG